MLIGKVKKKNEYKLYNYRVKDKDKDILNVIILGENWVGKTSIIKRFVYNTFNSVSISTIAITTSFKEIILKNNKEITIKLIDIGGQEKYSTLSKNYLKNADAVLYVFSHDREGSFEKIKEWKQLFNENNPRDDIPSYLINKK